MFGSCPECRTHSLNHYQLFLKPKRKAICKACSTELELPKAWIFGMNLVTAFVAIYTNGVIDSQASFPVFLKVLCAMGLYFCVFAIGLAFVPLRVKGEAMERGSESNWW